MGDIAGQRIGFIGLGRMGGPMARNLVAAGAAVAGWDLDPAARAGFGDAGSAAEAASGAGIVVTMLPDGKAVAAALDAAGIAPGTLVIDMSSCAPDDVRANAATMAARGAALIDAPVSGGVKKAVTGELSILVGGEEAQIARARPVLEAMGSRIFACGPVGSGAAMKALNNLLSAAGLAATVEVLQIGAASGLNPATMVDVLNASTGRNNTTEAKVKPFMLSGRYDSGFAMDLMVKDIGIGLDLAEGLDTPLSALTVARWRAALAALGHGTDHTELARWMEGLTGRSLVADG
jgi:3-hydroxyisobutyrate dehydrogenase